MKPIPETANAAVLRTDFSAAAAWGVENNLSLANMDFDEFADSVDADGVFRGFA